ncbi:MAG: hypothetical protein ACLPKE_06245 [Streptosporangiaceae bacterium]
MRDPELAARAGYAATRLEQAWERWRALRGLAGSSDLLASYVGYSLKEPMGQPRVVIGVDATEAEYFADLLESHGCAAVAQQEPRPANRSARPRVNGNAPTPGDLAPEPMVHRDPADQGHLGAAGAERPALTAPGSSPGSMTRALAQAPVDVGRPPGPPDPLAAELAGWTAGELPGQASQQLANWAAAESAPARTRGRTRDRSRTVRLAGPTACRR